MINLLTVLDVNVLTASPATTAPYTYLPHVAAFSLLLPFNIHGGPDLTTSIYIFGPGNATNVVIVLGVVVVRFSKY